MPIRSTQTTLDKYYAVQDDLLTGKIASYTIGDRTITLQNMKELQDIINDLESVIVAQEGGPIYSDISGIAHQSQWPEG